MQRIARCLPPRLWPIYTWRMLKSWMQFIILGMVAVACASSPSADDLPQEYSRIFSSDFDTVWRATQQAMLNYPMNINNMDTGTLQTLYITGKNRYQAPHDKAVLPNGFQYRINIKILASKDNKKTRISINKQPRLQRDFFSDPKDLVSDGYEEKALLYRIGREIRIETILKRAHEKDNE